MYYNKESIIYLDGEWVKATEARIDLFSQTLHYGSGVFEGIRAYDSSAGPNVFKAREHYERLLYSAQKMGITMSHTVDELIALTYELLDKNNISDAYIRPLVFLGANMKLAKTFDTHVMLAAWEWEPYSGEDPLKVTVSSYERPNPKSVPIDAKISGHYINSILATNEAKRKGFDEALLLDSNGYVAEGPGANFFYVKDGIVYTPALGNILPGITRATIIEYAMEMGYPVVEKFFTIDEVRGAEAAFFTGTATEIASISSIDDIVFETNWHDTIAYELFLMYRQRVNSNHTVV
jgi:branched-chain amino acid aminotransferase